MNENIPAMAKGAPKPVTGASKSAIQKPICDNHTAIRPRTHESPVSPEEVLGQRVEGDVGARTLGVVVRAAELGAGGGKATTGNEGGGHSGAESGSSVHLGQCQRQLRGEMGIGAVHAL